MAVKFTGREFKGLYNLLSYDKNKMNPTSIMIDNCALYAFEPTFSARIKIEEPPLNVNGEQVKPGMSVFDSWAPMKVSLSEASGLKVGDEIILESDGSWSVNGQQVCGAVSLDEVVDRDFKKRESIDRLLDNTETTGTDGFYMSTKKLALVNKLLDAFKVSTFTEYEFLPFSKPGAYMLRGRVSQPRKRTRFEPDLKMTLEFVLVIP